jgi:hypothetical protein
LGVKARTAAVSPPCARDGLVVQEGEAVLSAVEAAWGTLLDEMQPERVQMQVWAGVGGCVRVLTRSESWYSQVAV